MIESNVTAESITLENINEKDSLENSTVKEIYSWWVNKELSQRK